jgi:hypothetical protein
MLLNRIPQPGTAIQDGRPVWVWTVAGFPGVISLSPVPLVVVLGADLKLICVQNTRPEYPPRIPACLYERAISG